MSDSWALDIAREEELIGPPQCDAPSSSFSESPQVSPGSCAHYFQYFGSTEADCGADCDTPSTSDDGYDTACSPDISQEIQKKSCSTRGRKRKREDDNEAREKKKIKKNGSQRNRKREERYYMEALKRIFIHYDFIAAKTPKRAITHFETLKIARTKINGFIDDGVPDGQIKQICDRVLQKS